MTRLLLKIAIGAIIVAVCSALLFHSAGSLFSIVATVIGLCIGSLLASPNTTSSVECKTEKTGVKQTTPQSKLTKMKGEVDENKSPSSMNLNQQPLIHKSSSDLDLQQWHKEHGPVPSTPVVTQQDVPQPSCKEENDRRKLPIGFKLSQDLNNKVSRIWREADMDKEYACKWNYSIKGEDLLSLERNKLVNDQVINFYFKMIAESIDDRAVHTISSHFYSKLATEGYKKTKSFTRRVNIFDFDLIMVPIHIKKIEHWCLASIDFHTQRITYYDSLNGRNITCLRDLRDYLILEHHFRLGEDLDTNDWVLEHCKNIPRQTNSVDCGVFICMYARHIAHGLPMNFTQDDIPAIRKMMVAEIVQTKLFYDSLPTQLSTSTSPCFAIYIALFFILAFSTFLYFLRFF